MAGAPRLIPQRPGLSTGLKVASWLLNRITKFHIKTEKDYKIFTTRNKYPPAIIVVGPRGDGDGS